jgi:hypothetical protein
MPDSFRFVSAARERLLPSPVFAPPLSQENAISIVYRPVKGAASGHSEEKQNCDRG